MEKHIYFLTIVLVILVSFFIFRYLSNDYLEYKKLNPYLIEYPKQISQTSKIKAHKIRRSVDQHHGMEFTYAFWLKIKPSITGIKTIFTKGNNTGECPGVHISKNMTQNDNTMDLIVNMNVWQNIPDCDKYNKEEHCKYNNCKWIYGTVNVDGKCTHHPCENQAIDCNTPTSGKLCCPKLKDYCIVNSDTTPKCENKIKETCIVNNLPIDKWTHVIIMLVGNYLDIFINGNLYERFEIKGIPQQNTEPLDIGGSTPADGDIMRLQYFNYAIPASKINKIVSKTEITEDVTKELEDESTTDYLDRNYWIGENVDKDKRMF